MTFVKVAQEAARQAGKLLQDRISKAQVTREKAGAVDIVTDSDLAAQQLIIRIISRYFPNHGILAEESESKVDSSSYKYFWAIDPIDGTSAYAAGLPTYSSSIALLKKKEPIVAAIYLAITNEVVWAVKGEGAYAGEKRCFVSSLKRLAEATIGFDPSYFGRAAYIKRIAAPLSDKVRILPMIWSQAAALALVAKGIFAGYIQCSTPKVWDVAAGKLLVEEAGGVMTDFKGEKVDLFAINGYLAGSKDIHKKLLNFVRV